MSTPRHQAREAALRSLYFWEIGQTDPAQALETYFEIHQPDAPEAVREFARELVLGTAGDVASLDALIQQHSEHWRLGRLAVIDRLILRLGAWDRKRLDSRIWHASFAQQRSRAGLEARGHKVVIAGNN